MIDLTLVKFAKKQHLKFENEIVPPSYKKEIQTLLKTVVSD